jgi:hypothetical protein
MAPQLNNPNDFPSDLEHRLVRRPTPADVPPTVPSGHPGANPQVGVKRHVIRQVVVLEVVRPLAEVTAELDREVEVALADEPRGVVCDLSGGTAGARAAVVAGDQTTVIEAVARVGRHVRDWPGIPVAVACPDPQVQRVLHDHPLGGYLITAQSELTAVLAVLSSSPLAVRRLRLAPHPSAEQDSRDFVAFVLQDWGLEELILSAGHVVSELVFRSMVRFFSDMDISVSWDRGALRLCVRDEGVGPKTRRPSAVPFRREGHSAVADIARAAGSLPTAEGGKARWAVLNAALPGHLAARVALEGAEAETDLSGSW